MKARLENGIVTVYSKLPKVYNDIVGFQYATEEQLIENGFYDIQYPVLAENEIQGTPYLENNIIKYSVDIIPPKTEAELLQEEQDRVLFLNKQYEDMIFNIQGLKQALLDFAINGTEIPAQLLEKKQIIDNNFNTL